MIAACRSDANKSHVDGLVLPSDMYIGTDEEDPSAEHPMVLIRCFDSVQMVMSPGRLRAMAEWFNQSADWLEDAIQEGP